MMQWLPTGATLDEFRGQLRTFRSVFPHVTTLFGPGGYGMYMLGSDQPLVFNDQQTAEVLSRPGILEDISSAYDSRIHSLDAWIQRIDELRWISDAQVDAFVGDGPLITDDRPLPEYFLLRHWLFEPNEPHVDPNRLRAAAPGD